VVEFQQLVIVQLIDDMEMQELNAGQKQRKSLKVLIPQLLLPSLGEGWGEGFQCVLASTGIHIEH
jgi:hypothetical protein